MDHYPLDINLTVAWCDLDKFIKTLKKKGFIGQAESAQKQADEQLKEVSKTKPN